MGASSSSFVGPCPFCAEEIMLAARKCKHCGEWLTEPEDRPASAAAEQRIVTAKQTVTEKKAKKSGAANGCAAGCLVLVGLLGVVAVIGVMSSSGPSAPPSASADAPRDDSAPAVASPAPAPAGPDLVLKPNWSWSADEVGAAHIKGRVVNKSGRTFSYAQIEFNIYDRSGAQIDTAMSNTTNLEAGATWKFDAIAMRGADGSKAKCVALTGY